VVRVKRVLLLILVGGDRRGAVSINLVQVRAEGKGEAGSKIRLVFPKSGTCTFVTKTNVEFGVGFLHTRNIMRGGLQVFPARARVAAHGWRLAMQRKTWASPGMFAALLTNHVMNGCRLDAALITKKL
jgi:hypothetical protein